MYILELISQLQMMNQKTSIWIPTATFATSNETFSVSHTSSLSWSKVENIEEESTKRKKSISGNRIIDGHILLVEMLCPKCLSAVH